MYLQLQKHRCHNKPPSIFTHFLPKEGGYESLGLYLHFHTASPQSGTSHSHNSAGGQSRCGFWDADAIAIVEGEDIASMDAVIDKIVEVPEVLGTDSKVARWIQ